MRRPLLWVFLMYSDFVAEIADFGEKRRNYATLAWFYHRRISVATKKIPYIIPGMLWIPNPGHLQSRQLNFDGWGCAVLWGNS